MIALDLHTGKVRWHKTSPARTGISGDAAARGASHHRRAGLGPVRHPGRRLLELQEPRRGVRLDGTGDPSCTTRHPQPGRYLESDLPEGRPRRAPLRRLHERLELPRRRLLPHQLSARAELVRPAADSFAPTLGPEYRASQPRPQGVALIGTKGRCSAASPAGLRAAPETPRLHRRPGLGDERVPAFGGAAVDGSVVYLPCTDGVGRSAWTRPDVARLWHASGRWPVAGHRGAAGARLHRRPALPLPCRQTLGSLRRPGQPLRHAGHLRQRGPRPHPHRRGLRPDLLRHVRRRHWSAHEAGAAGPA